jgi:hypothetical protein
MRDLTKWPRLLVTGEPVTEQQADEILVRTDDWWLTSNDHAWAVSALAAQFGRPMPIDWAAPSKDHGERLQRDDEWRKSFGILPLQYVDNHQIMSAWIGGPHGWCDWAGRIGCSTYNIGKWPSVEEVTDDWGMIAAAFPYLDLTAQLVSDEGDGEPCGQWRVLGGKCTFEPEPTERICLVDDPMFTFLEPVSWERGVSLERLRQALETVKAARGGA